MLYTSITTIASTFVLQKNHLFPFPPIFKQTVKKGEISTEGLISDKPVLSKFWTFFYSINVEFFKGVKNA